MIAACLLVIITQAPTGQKVYSEMVSRLSKVNTVSGIKIAHIENEAVRVSFLIARPDRYKLESGDSQTFGTTSQIVIYDSKKKEAVTQHLAPGSKSFPVAGFETLFTNNADYYSIEGEAETVLIDGQKVWDVLAHPKDNPKQKVTLFVDQATMLPRGARVPGPQGPILEWLTEIKCDPVIDSSTLAWSAPVGSHAVSENPSADKLLHVGSFAPDFALESSSGATYRLSDVAAKHKATVISFWFYGCMACRQEIPDLVKNYDRMKAQGLEVLGVNVMDPMYRVQAFKKELEVSYPLLGGGASVGDAYGVVGCPTTYVLDGDRKIVATIVGGQDIEKLKAALEKLGLKPRD